MNWKAALMVLVIFFASAVTLATISLNVPELIHLGISERTTLDIGYKPMGDPVPGPGAPD